MNELIKLDQVAYVRFASVYKSFEDINEFVKAIDEIKVVPTTLKKGAGPSSDSG
jgi:transcriptional repressor NrdR